LPVRPSSRRSSRESARRQPEDLPVGSDVTAQTQETMTVTAVWPKHDDAESKRTSHAGKFTAKLLSPRDEVGDSRAGPAVHYLQTAQIGPLREPGEPGPACLQREGLGQFDRVAAGLPYGAVQRSARGRRRIAIHCRR